MMDPTLWQDQCLKKMQELLAKVKQTVQTKADMNFLDKYRCYYEITQPNLLVGGELKQYQLEALEWMINLASQNSNGILADDMGLGKTIQAISYLAYLKEENGIRGKHLVVCPKSVAGNWQRELTKWFPSAKVELMILTHLTREKFIKQIVRPRKFDVIIVNYEGAKTCFSFLSRIKWETLIIDQAHKIKNNQSQNFLCLNQLKATFRLLLTGTPLNNNLKELWSLLNFIMPEIFYEEDMFEQIEYSIKQFQGSEEEKLKFQCQIAKYFHQIINPFFKRRTKKELDLGLPEKKEMTLFVPLSKLQLRLYRNFLRCGNVYGDEEGPSNYNVMNPRKICQHPYLFEGITKEGTDLVEDSGKLGVLDKLLKKLISEKHKVLIFSQFVIMLDILAKYCNSKSYKYCRIDGSNSLEARDKSIRTFYDDPDYPIFLLSTKAGGLGLNLVAADRVIIYDIDWNPQNDLQATDRAYRIGQTKDVLVYRLITQFSIEERMLDFQKYKLIWDQLVIQKGAVFGKTKEDPFSNINFNHLSKLGKGDIFRLEAERRDQTIEEILKIGEEKNKIKEAEIREKLKQQINVSQKINPFEQEDKNEDEEVDTDQEDAFIQRRNYDHEKRERAKFERNLVLPAFKFYIHTQHIKDIEFEIYMQTKRNGTQNKKLLQFLYDKLQEVQSKGRFHNWSEHQFESFVKAHQLYRKTNYAQIAEHIGSKTEEEVKIYSEHFFEKAPNNERLINYLREIQRYQQKLKKMEKIGSDKEGTVKLVEKDNSVHNSGPSKKEDSNSSQQYSVATEDKKNKKKTPEEIQKGKQQKEQIKQEKERIKMEKEKARQEEKEAREKRREQEIKRKEENKLKREEEAKVREAAKKAKEEERIKRNEERQLKKQKDLQDRERKKIELEAKKVESQTKKKMEEAERVKKEADKALMKIEKEHSPSKKTEKSGAKQHHSQDSGNTTQKSRPASKGKIPIVTVHDSTS